MNFEEQIDVYFRARFTLVIVVTPEEERFLERVKEVCMRTNRPPDLRPLTY